MTLQLIQMRIILWIPNIDLTTLVSRYVFQFDFVIRKRSNSCFSYFFKYFWISGLISHYFLELPHPCSPILAKRYQLLEIMIEIYTQYLCFMSAQNMYNLKG